MKIIICPGSAEGQKVKRWSIKNFVELTKKFQNLDYNVEIILGPEEECLSKYFKNNIIHLSKSLSQLKKITLDTNLIICNDSFLLHFFSFLDKKVLALYGPTDPSRTMPLNAFKLTSKSQSNTRPCWGTRNYGRCIGSRCSCFDGLEVEDVLEETENILIKNSI